MKLKQYSFLFIIVFTLMVSACDLFKSNEQKIEIPEGVTEEQLQDTRYKYKRDMAYKEKYLQQTKTDSAIITIYDVLYYNIKDVGANVGDESEYLIFDISVDNPTAHNFRIGDFTNSCYLTNQDPNYHYSKVGMALKMHYLQSDSSEIDMEYIKRFYTANMPAKEFYRTKLFAFEVSKEDKSPLVFHYTIGNQSFEYKVRDERY